MCNFYKNCVNDCYIFTSYVSCQQLRLVCFHLDSKFNWINHIVFMKRILIYFTLSSQKSPRVLPHWSESLILKKPSLFTKRQKDETDWVSRVFGTVCLGTIGVYMKTEADSYLTFSAIYVNQWYGFPSVQRFALTPSII